MSKKNNANDRLWSINFFLLWQGQLVSALGDIIYELAMGFWILYQTGSTGLMGTLMAATVIPRVVISPFAGVIIDRTDRRRMLILMDIIRGACIVLVGIAALTGVAQVWMVFAAGVIIGICAAFFNPAVSSSIPDIVPTSKLVQGNAYFSMIRAGSGIIGNSGGGLLYQILGAPVLFLCNGISYLYAGFTELFVKIPKTEKQGQQYHFWTDMREGLGFIWGFKGLRDLIVVAGFLNFCANMGLVLFLPLFQRTKGLGETKYGIAMALLTVGMLVGMILTSAVNIRPKDRLKVFIGCGILSSVLFGVSVFMNNFVFLALLLFVSGTFNAVLNVLVEATVQLTVRQDMRGKVSSIMGTVLMGLSPIAMMVGGLLGEFFPLRYIIAGGFAATILIFIIFCFMDSFKKFIKYDPEMQKIESIM
ncbi:MFS transporter [Ruminiclostridium cellobioparum]|uniref:Arabinose efflux permease n=1 Tax=Ruminiclostridium cellobioparum subsp. termitidis CT1112 TaxID=1195236 RepID=S0FQB6_RUMCE|nr:MFS transporter [Ruminiclostridium cellobioparum]EMS72561.1 Arabinose efflux permease [Ruminiclostridium cellobioparum subsp. termitidis CT1112]